MNVERLNQLTVISWRPNSACVPVCDPRDSHERVELDSMKWMTNENKFMKDGRSYKVS